MTRSRSRRGANAIEFALLLPVLVVMLGGLIDYGWYYWREAVLLNGMREAVRSGGLQLPDTAETGANCAKCITMAKSSAAAELAKEGYTGVTVTPKIERVPATGSPCTYAVVIDTTIPHIRLFSLVPGPSTIKVRMVSMAQNLVCN